MEGERGLRSRNGPPRRGGDLHWLRVRAFSHGRGLKGTETASRLANSTSFTGAKRKTVPLEPVQRTALRCSKKNQGSDLR